MERAQVIFIKSGLINQHRFLSIYFDAKIQAWKKRDGRFTIVLFSFSLFIYGFVCWIYFAITKNLFFAFVSPTIPTFLNPLQIWFIAFFIFIISYLDFKEKIP